MKKWFVLFSVLVLFSCKKSAYSFDNLNEKNDYEIYPHSENKSQEEDFLQISEEKNTLIERFSPPKNYKWVNENPSTFGYFLEHFPLKPYGSKILKYDGTPINTQNLHEGIFDIDTGEKDLQQCADSYLRLRAEYLFKTKQFNKIKFHFTSGDLFSWEEYKKGTRVFVSGNKVSFRRAGNEDHSYQNFRRYLDVIFTYAGTISLNKETIPISHPKNLVSGDILITPGSPGHIVFIAGVCQNSQGKKLFLLAEGFTPAQSIHLLKNPFDPKISPWYELDPKAEEIKTARYYFQPANFRRYAD